MTQTQSEPIRLKMWRSRAFPVQGASGNRSPKFRCGLLGSFPVHSTAREEVGSRTPISGSNIWRYWEMVICTFWGQLGVASISGSPAFQEGSWWGLSHGDQRPHGSTKVKATGGTQRDPETGTPPWADMRTSLPHPDIRVQPQQAGPL